MTVEGETPISRATWRKQEQEIERWKTRGSRSGRFSQYVVRNVCSLKETPHDKQR